MHDDSLLLASKSNKRSMK